MERIERITKPAPYLSARALLTFVETKGEHGGGAKQLHREFCTPNRDACAADQAVDNQDKQRLNAVVPVP